MPVTYAVPPRSLADAADARDLVRKGQLDASSAIRGSSDYDDTGGAPSSTRAGLLWVPSSGRWAPRDVLLASDYGVANGVAELDSAGLLPAGRLPASAVTTAQRAPIGGTSSSTLSVAQTYSIDATGAPTRYFTLTANPTLAVPTNGENGQKISLWLLGSGATRTFTFASGYETSPTVPSRTISIASGTWELIEIENRGGTWRLARTDQLLFAPGDIGAATSGHSHPLVLFQGRQTTAQTLAVSGTAYPVNLQAEDYDNDNGHSTSTNISRWVCARAGTYQVDGAAAHGSGTGLRNAQINKNGAIVPGSFNQQAAASTSLNIVDAKQVFVDLAVGDYIELVTVQTQGSNVTMTVNASVYSVLRIRSLTLF